MKQKNPLQGRSLISILDLSKEEILLILKHSEQMKKKPPRESLKNKILASCFYEPSTRTRLSFEAAILRLGGKVIGFSDTTSTSLQKGESLFDATKVIGSYADLIVIRHPLAGSAQTAKEATDKPVINAGDGANQHPTQTLLDLFSIQECQGTLKGVHLVLAGDLKASRTTHSLSLASAHFGMRLSFVSHEALSFPKELASILKQQGVQFSYHSSLEEVLPDTDILFMTRIQKERHDPAFYEKIKSSCLLKKSMLTHVKKNFRILTPLPRVDEIDLAIDTTPYAYYFQQAENGLYVRMALLSMILQ